MKNKENDPAVSQSKHSDSNHIFIFDAEEGMVLAEDIIAEDGTILVPASTRLTIDLIMKISNHHILEIRIIDAPIQDTKKVTDHAEDEPENYFEKVRKTESYRVFQENFNSDVQALKDSLNDIILKNMPVNAEALLDNMHKLIRSQRNNLQLMDMLHSMRSSDDQVYAHCINVALISTIIGTWMDMPQKDIDILTLSGLLHDIGKLLVPNDILSKPGRLNAVEFEQIKQHPFLGFMKLKEQDIDNRIKDACLYHHEKCDGTGYPYGLKGDDIPVFAKIVSIADVYDAMTSNRVYRKSICPFDVVKSLSVDAFTKFDPEYLIPFLQKVVSSYIHNNVMLSNGQTGEVILINDNSLSQPVVRCGSDYINLIKHPELRITAIL